MWQRRFSEAQSAYKNKLEDMAKWWKQYSGERDAETTGVDRTYTSRDGSLPLVRNFSYELVESQIDSTIPQPKVTSPSKDEKKTENARTIEAMVKAVMRNLHLERFNDVEERLVRVLGGAGRLIAWDNSKGRDGEIDLQLLSPEQIVPQEGVYNLQDMDYVFTVQRLSKNSINARYDVDIDEWEQTEGIDDDSLVTDNNNKELIEQITCYFRNDTGGIGCFSWAGACILVNDEDYNARSDYVCKKCGKQKPEDDSPCSCGCADFEMRPVEYEQLKSDYILESDDMGNPIRKVPMMTVQKSEEEVDPIKAYSFNDDGSANVFAPTKIKYYTPRDFPVMLRRNVSMYGQFLGDSDIEKIRDMQIMHNNLALKVQDKLFKGGSILTLPEGLAVETSDRELKIVKVKQPEQVQMIQALNLQPTIQQDLQMLEKYYKDAKLTLGITDSYQGLEDNTAKSGIAKQAQIQQAAGRLESKSAMKWDSYCDMFRSIFQYMLAYSDEKVDFVSQGEDGRQKTYTFDRHDFLVETSPGVWEYDDDYIFEVDSAGGLFQNRQNLWQEIRQNFQSGAYGNPQDINTLIMFWSQMEDADYPNAGAIKTQLSQTRDVQQQQMQQMQMQQQQSGQMPEVDNALAQVDKFLQS